MPFDPNAPDLLVGVVGTGSMGRGIMQVAAQGGMRVLAYDEKPGAAQAAKAYIAKMLDGAVEKGRVPAEEAKTALGRIAIAGSLEEVAKANLIIEAIIERLEVKQAVFARLDALAGPDTIIASNTSSIRSRRPARTLSASAACISSIPCR
jgi:3-hydroxybutyryl-CoA dehydrogenase